MPATTAHSDNEFRKHLGESIRVLQVIVGALAAGCIAISLAAVFALPARDEGAPGEGTPTLTYVALGVVVMAFAAAAMASQAIVASARKRIAAGDHRAPRPERRVPWQHAEFLARFGDQARLSGIYFTKTIVAAAILEGAAYLGLGAFYVTHDPLALVATAAGVVGILFLFPTVSRCEDWIRQQLQRIVERRQLSGHLRPSV